MTKRSVLVIDDHFLFAQALSSVIKEMEDLTLAGIAVTGPQALAMVREQRPDIALLDYHLPGYSADQLIPRFRSLQPGIRVIVLTSDLSDDARESALAAGADHYMTKDRAVDDVVDALRAVAEGAPQLRAPVAVAAPPRPQTVARPAAAAAAPPAPRAPAGAPVPFSMTEDGRVIVVFGDVASYAQLVGLERAIGTVSSVAGVGVAEFRDRTAAFAVRLAPGRTLAQLIDELVRQLGATAGPGGVLHVARAPVAPPPPADDVAAALAAALPERGDAASVQPGVWHHDQEAVRRRREVERAAAVMTAPQVAPSAAPAPAPATRAGGSTVTLVLAALTAAVLAGAAWLGFATAAGYALAAALLVAAVWAMTGREAALQALLLVALAAFVERGTAPLALGNLEQPVLAAAAAGAGLSLALAIVVAAALRRSAARG